MTLTNKDLFDLMASLQLNGEPELRQLCQYLKANEGDEHEFVFDTLSTILSNLQTSRSRHIIMINEQIASGIREFIKLQQWTNLSQILRSLPHDLKKSVENEPEYAKKSTTKFADQVIKFMALGTEDRQKCLDTIIK